MKYPSKKSVIIWALIILIFILNHFAKLYDLKVNGVVGTCIITDYSSTHKSSSIFHYTFYFKGIKYTSTSEAGITNSSKFIGKYFPVIISKSFSYYNNRILVTPKHFNSVDIKYPDSLKWVLQYLKN